MSEGLEQLSPLLGEWTSASKTYPEGRGRMTVAPTEDGKFLRLHSSSEDKRFPVTTQIIGTDDGHDECTVLYYDSRNVRRIYHTKVERGVWTMWRDAPGFNQRFLAEISEDGRTVSGRWEVSEDGTSWKVDFDLTYTKVG